MQPGHGRDIRRDDCSQRHCPQPGTPGTWDGPDNQIPASLPGSRFRLATASALWPATSRTPPAPPRRPGSRPVLDLPSHKPRTGSYPETGDASHARLHTRPTPQYQSLTRPRSFRDDTGCVIRTEQVTVPFDRSPLSVPSREVCERSTAGTSQVSGRSAEAGAAPVSAGSWFIRGRSLHSAAHVQTRQARAAAWRGQSKAIP